MQVNIFILLLFLSAFLGPYFYLFIPKLHFIRIVPLLFLLVNMHVPFRFTIPLKVTGYFFVVYFLYTFLLSLVYFKWLELNDIVNFVVLHIFLFSIMLAVLVYPHRFYQTLEYFLWGFLAVTLLIAVWEEMTLNHLRLSSMNIEPKKWADRHLPTTFFTNANDFAAVYQMSVMFLLTIIRKRRFRFLKMTFLVLSCSWIIIVTDSRLSMLIFAAFLFFYFGLWHPKRIVQGATIVVIAAVIFFKPISSFIVENKSEIFSFTVTEGGSLHERWTMLKYGIKSVADSYTLGFGVHASNDYYVQYVGRGLTGITTDPHNFIIEILINSGLWMVLLYLLLNLYLLVYLVKARAGSLIILQFALYNLILLSSSSSLFLWPHYIFFIVYISYKDEFTDKPQTSPAA